MEYKFTLRQARAYAGLTHQELADKIGYSRATIMNWESGKTIPRINEIKAVAEATGVLEADIFLPCYST